MALIPSSRYPAQTDIAAAYPQGKARNSVTFNDGTGTPLNKDWVNDLFGFQQALLADAGLVPSGSPDQVGASQYLDAVLAIASRVPRREFVIFEDFMADHVTVSSGNESWDQRWTTTAPALTYTTGAFAGDNNVLGLATIANVSAGAITGRYRKGDGIFAMARLRRIACRMRLNSIAAGMGFRIGATYSSLAPIFNVLFEPATSPNWLLVSNGGFVANTGVLAVVNTFYEFDLRHDGASLYTLSVNGSAPVSPALPAHVPSLTDNGTLEWVLTTPASGANRSHQMDYVYALFQTPARIL